MAKKIPLDTKEELYIKRLNTDIRTSHILRAVAIFMFIGFILAESILLSLANTNSGYLKRVVCASGIGPDCPPPDAKSIALAKQLADASKKRDDALLKKIQELLDRPAEIKTIVREGATRTIIITRTRTVTVCRLPNGRPC